MSIRLFRNLLIGSFYIFAATLIVSCTRDQTERAASNAQLRQDTANETKLLATIAEDEKAPKPVAMADHKSLDPSVQQEIPIRFSENGRGVAYISAVRDGSRLVFNGKPGQIYREITDFKLALSPSGSGHTYAAKKGDAWFMVVDGKEYGPYENVGPPVYSPDNKHIAYEVQKKGKWQIAVDHTKFSPAYGSFFEKPYFNADSSRIAYVINGDETGKMRLVISDLDFSKSKQLENNFVYVFQNMDKTHFAGIVRTSDNKIRTVKVDMLRPEIVDEGKVYDDLRNAAFGEHGSTLAYAATERGINMLVINGKEERFPEAAVVGMTVLRPDNTSAALTMADKEGVFVHQGFVGKSSSGDHYEEADGVVYSRDGSKLAFAARNGKSWFLVVNGKKSPVSFDKIVSVQFVPDGSKVVFRARKADKRLIAVADAMTGSIIKEYQGYERVFEPVFTPDGKSIAYGVKDGRNLYWRVEGI